MQLSLLYLTMIGVASLAITGTLAFTAQESVPSCNVRGSYEWLSQRVSPLDSATIGLGGRTAKVCYSRPSARGRKPG